MPVQESQKPCGTADAEGEIRERIQTNGRCEAANPRGDTYGPVSYLAYLPGYAALRLDREVGQAAGRALHVDRVRPPLHARARARRLALRRAVARGRARVRLGGVPVHAVRVELEHERRDPALFLVWGFWLASSSFARGAFAALAGWTKFARCSSRRSGRRTRTGLPPARGALRRRLRRRDAGVLLDPPARAEPVDAARTFWDRTFGWQLGRESPFSIWDWGQYHARGIPDLHLVQLPLIGLVLAGSVAVAFWPRTKSPLQLAALTGALLLGFQLVLTHWFYLYIPWFFPFVAFAVLAPSVRREPEEAVEPELPRAGSAAALRAVLSSSSWALLLHEGFYERGPDRRHAGLRALRRGDRGRRRCRTATSRSSIRRRRCPSSSCPALADYGLPARPSRG